MQDNGRETGIVMAVKDAYGFIRCADREDKVFFHFSELTNASNEHEVQRGDEVSFVVICESETGRFSAVSVQLLEPGTVVFEDIAENLSPGIIERELQGVQSSQYGRRSSKQQQEPFGGRIRVRETDIQGLLESDVVQRLSSGEVLLEFSGRDVEDPRVILKQNDKVMFRLFTERRSGRQGATGVCLVSASGDRETGVVVCVKESYGFLKCSDRDYKQLFFHFSELVEPDTQLQPGTELEFSVAYNKRGQLHATRILQVQSSSANCLTVDETIVSGVIDQGIHHHRSGSGSGRRTLRPNQHETGSITVDEIIASSPDIIDSKLDDENNSSSSSSTDIKTSVSLPVSRIVSPTTLPKAGHHRHLSFSGKDLVLPRIELKNGDKVSFNVAIDNRTQAASATHVKLVTPCPDGRERGIITVLKAQYGFIRCQERSTSLFFHVNELINSKHIPQLGDEIEFNVQPDNRGQQSATRIMLLSRGTVLFDELELFGAIIVEPYVDNNDDDEDVDESLSAAKEFRGEVQLQVNSIKLLQAQIDAAAVRTCTTPTQLTKTFSEKFSKSSLLSSETALRVGDEVAFMLRRNDDSSIDDERISNMRLLHKTGVVVKSAEHSDLCIRLLSQAEKGGIDMAKNDAEHVDGEFVSFTAQDMIDSKRLKAGDLVSIQTLSFNPKIQLRQAHYIEVVAETHNEQNDSSSSKLMKGPGLRKRLVPTKRVRQIVRMARGPDGTAGFAVGRGAPLDDTSVANNIAV